MAAAVNEISDDDEDCNWNEVQTFSDPRYTSRSLQIASNLEFGASSKSKMEDSNMKVNNSNSKPKDRTFEECSENVHRKDNIGPSRMSLNDHKAGMEGLDKERINKIIYEASKGSKFYENELKKEQQMTERIRQQTARLESCTEQEKVEASIEADRIVRVSEDSRELRRTIVHIDMDAFYAAVEMRDNPSLGDKPMAVGSMGMLSTSNYPARRFGVRAAMPGFIGKKLCPELVIVPLHFDKYREVSHIVRGIFTQYDPNYLPMSLDEAYLDLTDYLQERGSSTKKRVFYKFQRQSLSSDLQNQEVETKHCLKSDNHSHSDHVQDKKKEPAIEENPELINQSTHTGVAQPGEKHKNSNINTQSIDPEEGGSVQECFEFGNDVEEVVREIRYRIEQETELTASAGIACNVMLSKVCTDQNKPNGQFYLKPDREEIIKFVWNLPIRKVSGIGRVSEQMLKALGVTTCADLYAKRDLLVLLNSSISARSLIGISLGIGATRLENNRERKSLGTERTFSEISNPLQLISECEKLCQSITKEMHEEYLRPKTITLKLKTVNFEVKTRSASFPQPLSLEEEISSAARDLLCKEIKACEPRQLKLRLMGVRLSNFQNCGPKVPKQDTIISFFARGNNSVSPKKNSLTEDQIEYLGENAELAREPDWLPSMNTFALLNVPATTKGSEELSAPQNNSVCNLYTETAAHASTLYDMQELSQQEHKSNAEDNSFTAVCPVCCKPQTTTGPNYLTAFNEHVDLCLNMVAIKEALSEDKALQGQSVPNPVRPKDNHLQPSPKSVKGGKRKQQNARVTSQTKRRTLETFWSK